MCFLHSGISLLFPPKSIVVMPVSLKSIHTRQEHNGLYLLCLRLYWMDNESDYEMKGR